MGKNGLNKKELKEMLSYIKDPQYLDYQKRNCLIEIEDYFNYKYKTSNIKLDYENNKFIISGENIEEIVNQLETIGISNNDYETRKDI